MCPCSEVECDLFSLQVPLFVLPCFAGSVVLRDDDLSSASPKSYDPPVLKMGGSVCLGNWVQSFPTSIMLRFPGLLYFLCETLGSLGNFLWVIFLFSMFQFPIVMKDSRRWFADRSCQRNQDCVCCGMFRKLLSRDPMLTNLLGAGAPDVE